MCATKANILSFPFNEICFYINIGVLFTQTHMFNLNPLAPMLIQKHVPLNGKDNIRIFLAIFKDDNSDNTTCHIEVTE